MPKRSVYIGLSSPIFYDYKNMLKWPYPNPVLEAPLGLMILYDEIIFIDKIVCPKGGRVMISNQFDNVNVRNETRREYFAVRYYTSYGLDRPNCN
jgi:hypothetical protein